MSRLFTLALLAAAAALPASAQSIGGVYRVEGTNPNGSRYGGQAQIRLTSDTTCEIAWTTGSTTSRGICMRNGDSFAAGYVLGNSTGLVIYRILPDGVLDGLWTIAGQNGNGTERLIPIR
jgi:hypothetical protein